MDTLTADVLAQLERISRTASVSTSATRLDDNLDYELHSELGDIAGLLECPC